MKMHENLKFFTTPPHECSYLSGRQATTLFIDPDIILNQDIYSNLAEIGFRRSGNHMYRPHCAECHACIPTRVPAKIFSMNRSQRRTWLRNSDLQVRKHNAVYTSEYYSLYKKYISLCHPDGDMHPATVEQFKAFLVEGPEFTQFYEYRLDNRLLAVSVVDSLNNGLSAIYTFYDPDYSRRSLGRYCILWLIHEVQRLEMSYLHLGYWIKNCRKMSYKIDYKPVELFLKQCWIRLK